MIYFSILIFSIWIWIFESYMQVSYMMENLVELYKLPAFLEITYIASYRRCHMTKTLVWNSCHFLTGQYTCTLYGCTVQWLCNVWDSICKFHVVLIAYSEACLLNICSFDHLSIWILHYKLLWIIFFVPLIWWVLVFSFISAKY